MGTPDFAVLTLECLCAHPSVEVVGVVTVPDRPTGRGQHLTASPVKLFAQEHGIAVLQPERLRDEQFLADLRSLNADLFIVVAFRMLPQCVWAMPPQGTFNLHASLLPQYRGAAPINWAIINGEHTTGVTTFMLNERIDEGGILLQESVPILDTDDAGTLHDRLATVGAALVARTIDGLVDHTLTPRPQPAGASFSPAPKIFKQDCIIRWDMPVHDIVRMVRGLSPYPAAIMLLRDTKGQEQSFKLFQVAAIPDPTAMPGTLSTDRKNYLRIGANGGYVDIISLQINGKKRNDIKEFLLGKDVTDWKTV